MRGLDKKIDWHARSASISTDKLSRYNIQITIRYFICQCSDNICWCSDKQKMGKVGKSICKQFWWIITDNICKTSQFICEKLPKMEKNICEKISVRWQTFVWNGLPYFCGRYPLNLQQVPAGFAAATCWICGGYLLISRQVPAGFAAGTC